ncbi:MAG: cysteine desulfurase family protein [Bacillota bacterium]|nr:cysteine desulfurase family protein [Bacillota bacterium]
MRIKEVYIDNSATTRPYPEVISEMSRVMDEEYGNPSSLHRRGSEGERILNTSRQVLADILGVKNNEVIFTSGGTESNNLAILGIARRNRRRGNHLVTTAIEHSSVLQAFNQLEKEGFEVTYLVPEKNGVIDPQKAVEALTSRTILVSIMHVNNEIGSIQPISRISKMLKAKNPAVIFHVDAVQSFTKFSLSPQQQGIDLLSMSAHKFHGPKGVGTLYIKDGIHLEPLNWGGGHEKGLRPGTENTPGIAGMALAAKISTADRRENMEKMNSLKEKLISSILTEHPWAQLNGPLEEEGAPHIFNISFPGLKGEIILHALEEYFIYVSTGSSCHSSAKEPSHVLRALGLNEEATEGAIRFSLSHLNTEEEMDYAASKINSVIAELANFHKITT